MDLPSARRTSALVLLLLTLLTACSREVEPTPQPTVTPIPPYNVTYCDIGPTDICLEGFGQDSDDRLLVLFNVINKAYTNIYIRADYPDGEVLFECLSSEDFPENIYCLGEPFPEDELIKLNIYSKNSNKLIAIGVFNVQYGGVAVIPDVVFGVDATPTPPLPSYPNPSYPNPAYPNPTSAP